MLRSFEAALEGVTEVDERLSVPRALVREAHETLASTLDRYRESWLARYGVRPRPRSGDR
jgi:hypothetical protein